MHHFPQFSFGIVVWEHIVMLFGMISGTWMNVVCP
jgi:hypothetical protein